MTTLSSLNKAKILPSVNLEYATVSMREDGIVNTNILISKPVTLVQAKELLEAYIDVTGGVKSPHLFTVTKLAMIENDVMEFISNEGNKKGIADAFVIHSLPQKILGNFYLKFIKPSIPSKFFSSEEKAIAWLKSIN